MVRKGMKRFFQVFFTALTVLSMALSTAYADVNEMALQNGGDDILGGGIPANLDGADDTVTTAAEQDEPEVTTTTEATTAESTGTEETATDETEASTTAEETAEATTAAEVTTTEETVTEATTEVVIAAVTTVAEDETGISSETEMTLSSGDSEGSDGKITGHESSHVGLIIAAVILAVVIIAAVVAVIIKNAAGKKHGSDKADKTDGVKHNADIKDEHSDEIKVAKLHNIGMRSSQQDCLGSVPLDGGKGVLAIVADGMGGLSGGEQVSQTIVKTMLSSANALPAGMESNHLTPLLKNANEVVNVQLGESGLYKSGSTVVAALVRNKEFHWISVGDSRIYLYRGGSLIQLNREHILESELMEKFMNGEMTIEEVKNDPQRKRLTSFIGMGRLKHIDGSVRKTELRQGDVILLLSDGVFNRTPETVIASIIDSSPDLNTAAERLEEYVANLHDPAQDNFTAMLIGY